MINWFNKVFIKNAKPQGKKVVVELRFAQQSFRLEDLNAPSKTPSSPQDLECLNDSSDALLTKISGTESEEQVK